MRHLLKTLTVFIFLGMNIAVANLYGQVRDDRDTLTRQIAPIEITQPDSVQLRDQETKHVYNHTLLQPAQFNNDTVALVDSLTMQRRLDMLMSVPLSRTDSLLYLSNPLVLPLIYIGKDIHEVWNGNLNTTELLYPSKKSVLYVDTTHKNMPSEFYVAKLRRDTRKHLANNNMSIYTTTVDRLPQLSSFMSRPINRRRLQKLEIYDDKIVLNSTKIQYEPVKPMYWIKKANTMFQFSQNYVSANWHQGGLSNLAFLSTFTGELNYDNQKKIQWENKLEWRLGFNSIDGDTLRKLSTNDDLLRYLTKFGLRASGNWYYSVSGEFSTQLLNNYTGINSTELKSKLFTPVRASIGIGMDFKYKKTFSLMIAPLTFKYIYMSDTVNVNPNLFGLQKGENCLKQVGSSLLAQLNYSPMINWTISSKFTFYTDYNKIEADWEIVNDFTINRFLTARLLMNPRYDNTVILKEGEKARIQFKELLSIGFSYRLL